MSDFSRRDGHDPARDENCATGLCEHERGSALPRHPAVPRPAVITAFLGAGRAEKDGGAS